MAELDNSEKTKMLAQELWIKYEPGIRLLCNKKLSSYPQEVDDVVSETYVALLTALSEHREIDNIKGWLYGTANNLIGKKYEEIKERRKRYISINDAYYYHKLSYEVDVLEPKVSDEKIDCLKAEIESELSYEENKLIELLYDKKMKQRKVAKMYNTTENALKQRSYRLRIRVKGMAHDKIKKLMNRL